MHTTCSLHSYVLQEYYWKIIPNSFYLLNWTRMTSINRRYFLVQSYVKYWIILQFYLRTAHNFSYGNLIKRNCFSSSTDLSVRRFYIHFPIGVLIDVVETVDRIISAGGTYTLPQTASKRPKGVSKHPNRSSHLI